MSISDIQEHSQNHGIIFDDIYVLNPSRISDLRLMQWSIQGLLWMIRSNSPPKNLRRPEGVQKYEWNVSGAQTTADTSWDHFVLLDLPMEFVDFRETWFQSFNVFSFRRSMLRLMMGGPVFFNPPIQLSFHWRHLSTFFWGFLYWPLWSCTFWQFWELAASYNHSWDPSTCFCQKLGTKQTAIKFGFWVGIKWYTYWLDKG